MTEKDNKAFSFAGLLKTLGPGILYAGAAIGASHLVLSTRAGASYSFNLIWAILLINLFKYPFFEFSYRYTASTGNSLLDGYKKLGNWAIITFFILSFFTAIVNFAAVTKVTSDLAAYFFGINFSSFTISTILLILILLMLFVGKYAFLDKMMKFIILVLALFTIVAFIFALNRGPSIQEGFIHPELWDTAGLTFLLVLMGWMPTPIDASVWPSLWAMERKKQTGYTPSFREYKADFHIGYIGSTVLAIFFLGLGALIMYGSGEQFSENGVIFSQQLVGLYKKSIGNWTSPIIATIVLLTMFSTAVTVIDGYPRSLSGSMSLIFPSISTKHTRIYYFWIIILSLSAIIIIGFFTKNMRTLLEFATIISFLTAPFFAFINYKVVTSKFMPKKMHPPVWLKFLSWSGMIYLLGFSFVYLYIITF